MRHCPARLVCLFTVLALAGTTSVMANNETTTPPPSLPGLLSSFAGSKILLIGILDSDLTIITKDTSPLVYDVPMAKFDKSKVDLYGLKPVELSSKWPALSGNANFTSTLHSKPRPQSIFIKLDNEKLIFAFDFSHNENQIVIKTVTLSVNQPSASYQEYGFEHSFDFFISNFISSTEQNVFFNLVINPGNPHKLTKYVFQAGGFNLMFTSTMCKQTGANGTEMIVFMKDSIGCIPIDWDIQNGGFVNQNRFHLFSHDIVYIFEYTGAGGANPAGVPVTAVKLNDFFVSVTPTTTTTHSYGSSSRKAGVSTGIIIALVCGVLLILGIIIAVVVWCKCYKKHPHPKDHEMNRSSSSRKGTVGQSQSQVSSSQFPKLQSPSAQGNNTSGLKNPTETTGKQTQKAKLAKLASKHSKAKGSKGSVATGKPTTKKSSRRVASKGGKKGSKASKGSNRKF